jgi:serine/threonine protein kinase
VVTQRAPRPHPRPATDAGGPPPDLGATREEHGDPWVAAGLVFAPELARRYRLCSLVASGGAVDAFLARHVLLENLVLIKALPPGTSADDADRFLAEATALWTLSHPSFPAVLDYGTDLAGRPYVIMEYATGSTLSDSLAESLAPLEPSFALDVALQVASAVAAAHAQGVTHGALSPDAIHVCPDAALDSGVRIKIADFSAARGLRASRPHADLVAVGHILGELAARVASGPVAALLHELADATTIAGGRVSMGAIAVELRRQKVESGLERGTFLAPKVSPRATRRPLPLRAPHDRTRMSRVALFLGAAVVGGALGLLAVFVTAAP